MSSINRVTILGNLGADPEVRYTQGGQPVASLRIATNEAWTDKAGVRQERTEWHKVSVFGKQAETCGEWLQKGRQVLVEGRLQTREWTDKENVKRWSTEIVASNVIFLGNGGDKADRAGTRGAPVPPEHDTDGAFGFEDTELAPAATATPAAAKRPLRVSGSPAAAGADIPF